MTRMVFSGYVSLFYAFKLFIHKNLQICRVLTTEFLFRGKVNGDKLSYNIVTPKG